MSDLRYHVVVVSAVIGMYRKNTEKTKQGWFWWTCLPGCLPDSEPFGPFASELEAIDDAREDH